MRKIDSPLAISGKASLVGEVDLKKLKRQYLKMGIEVNSIFKSTQKIEVYQCETSGYRFYYPLSVSGDSRFYEQLQLFDWYYMPWKWEHEIALGHISNSMSVLEVGCAHGSFLQRISEEYSLASAVGLELNETAVQKNEKWQIYNKSIEEFAEGHGAEFDIVCSFEVLEHISNVSSFIKACVKCLKVGGKLIYAVPNNDSYIKLSSSALNMPPHHMGLWDSHSLVALTNIFPLKLEKIELEPLQDYHVLNYIENVYYSNSNTFFGRMKRKIDKIRGRYNDLYLKTKDIQSEIVGHTILAVYTKL